MSAVRPRIDDRPLTTGELAEALGENRFVVMQHLALLREACLVSVLAKGRRRINFLNPIPIQHIYGDAPMDEQRQVHVVEINAPIAEVWAEITKLRQIQKPMFNTVLETDFKPGSRSVTVTHSKFVDQQKTADAVRPSVPTSGAAAIRASWGC